MTLWPNPVPTNPACKHFINQEKLTGISLKPASVMPSMTTESTMAEKTVYGRTVWGCTGMLKAVVSLPEMALGWVMIWRKEPAPLSLVLITTKIVSAKAAGPCPRRPL
jgi:hypothetical protein